MEGRLPGSLVLVDRRRGAFRAFAYAVAVAIALAALSSVGPQGAATDRPFPALYTDPKLFLNAMAQEALQPLVRSRVTGISVPHHLLAADLIVRGFRAAARQQYDRIIIISPDHFSRSRRPMATTRRDIDSVFGLVHNDRAATGLLLQAPTLFDDSGLFEREHGIAALLPFVRRFFPHAKIVPIAITYGASRAECDQALGLLDKLIGPRTLVVQSTDYSHYLPANAARDRDQETLNIIAGNDADAVMELLQPAHLDSKASQYVQMQVQKQLLSSYATVIANRNASHYGPAGAKTTSYIVTVYTEKRPKAAELSYPDQELLYVGGDTFIGRGLTAAFADREIAASLVGKVKAVTGGAPLIVNLEGTILDDPPEGTGPDAHVMYTSLAIPGLRALNVKVAGLANNHAFDLGAAAFQETGVILQKSAIAPLSHKQVVDIGPLRLLGLNFIGSFDHPELPVVRDNDLDELCRMAARPPLLALVHWGREYNVQAGTAEYTAAQAMQRCGVSAIVGAHSHRAAPGIEAMQGGEYQLTYSLGNLLFDQTSGRASGALLELRAFQQGTLATRLIPIPNLFDLAVEQLQRKEGRLRLPPGPAGIGD